MKLNFIAGDHLRSSPNSLASANAIARHDDAFFSPSRIVPESRGMESVLAIRMDVFVFFFFLFLNRTILFLVWRKDIRILVLGKLIS